MVNTKSKISVDLDNNLVNTDQCVDLETELDKFFAQDEITDQDLTSALNSAADKKLNNLYRKSIEKYVVKKSYQQSNILSKEINEKRIKVSKITSIWMIFIVLFIILTMGCALALIFVTDQKIIDVLTLSALCSQLCVIATLIGCLISTSVVRDKLLNYIQTAMMSGIPIIPQSSNYISSLTEKQKEVLTNQIISENNFAAAKPYKRSGLKLFGAIMLIFMSLIILGCGPLMFVYKNNLSIFKLVSLITFAASILAILSFVFIFVGQRKEIKNLLN